MRAGKRRSQAAAFSATPPGGKLYVQRVGTDNPVVWSVQFRFARADAATFIEWFNTDIQGGLADFTLPIRTEFGAVTYTCRFRPEGLLDCREDGETFTYTATIMARAQVLPDGYADAAEMIIGLPDWRLWADLLDQTITEAMPEA